jgi:hypothetical protein
MTGKVFSIIALFTLLRNFATVEASAIGKRQTCTNDTYLKVLRSAGQDGTDFCREYLGLPTITETAATCTPTPTVVKRGLGMPYEK